MILSQAAIFGAKPGDPELGRMVGMSVYTAPDGDPQREDLAKYTNTSVRKVSPDELLDAMNRGYPSSVFLDGRKLAGSVFKGILRTELGLPIRHPRLVQLEDPEGSE